MHTEGILLYMNILQDEFLSCFSAVVVVAAVVLLLLFLPLLCCCCCCCCAAVVVVVLWLLHDKCLWVLVTFVIFNVITIISGIPYAHRVPDKESGQPLEEEKIGNILHLKIRRSGFSIRRSDPAQNFSKISKTSKKWLKPGTLSTHGCVFHN